ncbi:hypothetical protein [Rhizobium phaseoli]|uniref:hypothetical protein n=1 Tax=Rhizobium phaseoli TaxID=396 RepID=UPI003CC96FD3
MSRSAMDFRVHGRAAVEAGADTSPAELRAFGMFNLITVVALLLASVIAGALWDLAGPQNNPRRRWIRSAHYGGAGGRPRPAFYTDQCLTGAHPQK